MIYYLILFIWFITNALIYELKKRENKWISKIDYIILIFIFSFSYNMGSDIVEYKKIFYLYVKNMNISDLFQSDQSFEKGYLLINLIGSNLNLNYYWFMSILITIIIIITMKNIKERSLNQSLAILLYLFYYFFTNSLEPTIRQMLAITLFIMSLKYIERGNKIKFILTIILGSLFHKSILLMLPCYFLRKLKLNNKKICLLVITIGIISLFQSLFLENLKKILPFLNVYIERYLYKDVDKMSYINIVYLYLRSIIFLWIIKRYYVKLKKSQQIIENLAILGVLILPFQSNIQMIYRINGYFYFTIVICLSSLGSISKNIATRILIITIFIIIQLAYFIKPIVKTETNMLRYIKYENYLIRGIEKTWKDNEIFSSKDEFLEDKRSK